MAVAMQLVDDVLCNRWTRLEPMSSRREIVKLVMLAGVGSLLHGAVMGSSLGWEGDRWLQVCYSALKTPLLLMATFALSLPSFYVANTLLGLRQDFSDAIQSLLRAQAVLVVVLTALAPYIALWYASSESYAQAIAINGFAFLTASLAGQIALRRNYRRLIARNHRHRWLLWTWLVIYLFVGIQMAWSLRPFIGSPTAPVQFLRRAGEGNAYIAVWRVGVSAIRQATAR